VPTFLLDTLKQIGAIWKRLSAPSRVAVAATLVLAVGGLLVVTFWARTPSFVVLESDLDSARAGRIATALEDLGVPYETRDRGMTILVPSRDVARARLKLGGQGLLFTGDAPEEEDASPWMGPEERQAKRVRRLQTDITRAVQSFRGVEQAKVILSPGKDSTYRGFVRPPKASIIVWPADGRQLGPQQVEGIVRTATNAVTGLTEENVSVVSGDGRVLTRRKGSPGNLVADDTMAVREAHERALEEKAGTILDGAFGPGSYRVAVTVQMSFDTTTTTETEYFDDRKVVSKETSTKESAPTGGGAVGGDPSRGADAKLGASLPPTKKEMRERDYLVPQKETTETRNTPKVIRVTAGISVDQERCSEEDQRKLKPILARALGIQRQDPSAPGGDPYPDLEISRIPFVVPERPEGAAESAGFDVQGILDIAQYAAAGLAGLGLLLFFRSAFKGRGKSDVPGDDRVALDLTIGDEDEEPAETVNPKVRERLKIKNEIARAIERDPRGVSKLIEMWLHEESA
jgi:flagellar biosynthesis/type III secretory pathway M-ring protein FliF/YscJ